MPPSPPRADVPEAVRVQILATEHWGLLATRSITYGAVFSRTSIFLTVVSAAVVALALVGQATDFGDRFYLFALLVLPVALFIGIVTFIRLIDAWLEDFWLVYGMNRLRHAYLELAPELEPYFITPHYDDEASILQVYGANQTLRFSRIVAGTPTLVGAINVVVVGVLAALIADTLGASDTIDVAVGIIAALAAAAGFGILATQTISAARRAHRPQFPR